jgi:hypothetical protein
MQTYIQLYCYCVLQNPKKFQEKLQREKVTGRWRICIV